MNVQLLFFSFLFPHFFSPSKRVRKEGKTRKKKKMGGSESREREYQGNYLNSFRIVFSLIVYAETRQYTSNNNYSILTNNKDRIM